MTRMAHHTPHHRGGAAGPPRGHLAIRTARRRVTIQSGHGDVLGLRRPISRTERQSCVRIAARHFETSDTRSASTVTSPDDPGKAGPLRQRRRTRSAGRRPLCARPALCLAFPRRQSARAGRDGRGLPRKRSEAEAVRRAQVPSGRSRSRSAVAGPVPQRSAPGAPDLAPERVPRVRHRRGRRRRYISMEYIDGEDLASLLRRIGRLPRTRRSRSRVSCAPAWRRRTTRAWCTVI